jgi:ParB-like chromosome segregation protein Spo0J
MGTAQLSRREQGLPAFEVGSDGFPRPGQVIRHFRQITLKANGKPWTQRDLAQFLGKQELAVREMELRDVGLNDIIRQRGIAELFAIPPSLLGLVTVPEQRNKGITTLTWWVRQEFPAFEVGSDGFPRPGQVIRHFRQITLKADRKPWTQRDLAQVLGKQELAVREMELRDIGLNDISRRRFLAHLFDIPPILLGLATIPQQSSVSRQVIAASAPNIISVSKHIDLEEIRARLTGFWTQNEGASQEMFITLDTILKRLYERYPTTVLDERIEVVTALCELHIHAANLLRDRGRFNKSLEHLNKTEALNALLNEDELLADVFYRRGGLYLEKGELVLALNEYHSVEKKLANISPPLQAAILLEMALSEARIAKSKEQYNAALKKLDQAGRIIRVKHTEVGREKWPYLRVDLERYHLDRAATLIVVGNPEEAQQELNLLSFSQLKGRRSVYHLILQAQAYFGLKEYTQAALLAEEALPLVRTMHSRVNLERIKTLYKQFQQTSFRNNPEVGRLSYLLFHT